MAAAALLVLGITGQPTLAGDQELASAPEGNIEQGKEVFLTIWCYACYGIDGQGGFGGPKLGPDPMSFSAFVRYVLAPVGTMPSYTEALLPDERDLADIHA